MERAKKDESRKFQTEKKGDRYGQEGEASWRLSYWELLGTPVMRR